MYVFMVRVSKVNEKQDAKIIKLCTSKIAAQIEIIRFTFLNK